MHILDKTGLVCILFFVALLMRFILFFLYDHFLAPIFNKMDIKAKGQWALVTGCTDGIGKEYAKKLAGEGCDIVLVSRSMEKLTATAEEIETEYKVNTKIVQADFSEGDHIYQNIAQAIAGLEIGTLVNNVGVSYLYPEYFLDVPECDAVMTTMIRTNITSVVKMTSMVLPDMVKRENGIIINIGSAASMIPSPLLTGYAASKAFVEKFSEGLDLEYGKKGIFVQCILPGFVCSNMSGIRQSTLLAPTAKTFVDSAFKMIGIYNKNTGYVPHSIFVNALNLLNTISGNFCYWLVTRSMENSRRKALKKYKKQ